MARHPFLFPLLRGLGIVPPSHLFIHPAADHSGVGFGFRKGRTSRPTVLLALILLLLSLHKSASLNAGQFLIVQHKNQIRRIHLTALIETKITLTEFYGLDMHHPTLFSHLF